MSISGFSVVLELLKPSSTNVLIYLTTLSSNDRTNRRRCSLKKSVDKNFAKFTCDFVKFLTKLFLQNISGRLLLQ